MGMVKDIHMHMHDVDRNPLHRTLATSLACAYIDVTGIYM